VDPKQFFTTAELLKDKPNESHLRTSVGRSYYAAFLYFRELLRNLGLEKKKNPAHEAHEFVVQCLQFSRTVEGEKAAEYLRDLRRVRTDADYHLNIAFSEKDADYAYVRATRVVADYERGITPAKKKILRHNAMAHARQKGWV
jgi:uncharacterized protein (UPF0332 family)